MTEKTQKTFLIILAVLMVFSVGVAIFLAWQNYQLRQELIQQQSTPTFVISPSPIVDETAGWETYTNNIRQYSIKYPLDWNIETTKAETNLDDIHGAELLIFQGKYKIKISWPSGYSPSMCLFDDQDREQALLEWSTICEGQYKQFNSRDNKKTYRRLINPELFDDYYQWRVYTKENSYYVTVPPTQFVAPPNYQTSFITTMDQILSTFKFLD